MTAARVGVLLRIVNLARSLQLSTIRLRSTATADVLARRIGTAPDDPTVALIAAVWASVTATAWQSMSMSETLDQTAVEDLPDFMSRSLTETFNDLVDLTVDLRK
jgi:hypothetical protein